MRMITGKEERTIADRISDPNRPTWEQFKKDNAEKLDMNGTGEKEMLAYRKKLDAAREKVGDPTLSMASRTLKSSKGMPIWFASGACAKRWKQEEDEEEAAIALFVV